MDGRSRLTRGFLDRRPWPAPGRSSDGFTVGMTWVAASAKAALVPTGTRAVMACSLTAAAFRVFAASRATGDSPGIAPFGSFTEAITTVSALVSMSGRAAGSGPKTERFRFAALPAGPASLSAPASSPAPAASAGGGAVARDPPDPAPSGSWPPRTAATSTMVSSRMSCGRVMSGGRSASGIFGAAAAGAGTGAAGSLTPADGSSAGNRGNTAVSSGSSASGALVSTSGVSVSLPPASLA